MLEVDKLNGYLAESIFTPKLLYSYLVALNGKLSQIEFGVGKNYYSKFKEWLEKINYF